MAETLGSSSPDRTESWAVAELGRAQLGDPRRTSRLVTLATALADRPCSSVPQACGTWAATKGACRFLSNEDVEPADSIAAHRLATIERLRRFPVVLAVQDTTYVDFTSHRATRGLGRVTTPGIQGFFAHSCLAVAPDGVPLGLLGQHLWVRPVDENKGDPEARRHSATDGKESARWLEMLETSTLELPEGTQVVTVADREGDMYEFFVAAVRLGQHVLVRAAHNRRLLKEQAFVWDVVERAPPVGHLRVANAAGR